MTSGFCALLGMFATAKYLDSSSPGEAERREYFWKKQRAFDAETKKMRRDAGLKS